MSRRHPLVRGEYQAAVAKILRGLVGQRSMWQLWRDFMAISACSLSSGADISQRTEREAEYRRISKGYSKGELRQLSEAFALVAEGLGEKHCDFLGSLFMTLDLGDAWRGQFFTPYEVSLAMAKMTLVGAREQIARTGFITVSDPCVGGGAMVIAAAQALMDDGINYQRHMHVTAQDIDLTSVHMAYIQLSLLFVPAVVIHGNSLLVEERSHWFTPAHVLGGWNAKLRQRDALEAAGELMAGPPAVVIAQPEPQPAPEPRGPQPV